MSSPADLTQTFESMHLSESSQSDDTPPTTIADLPNESLNRIFELVAEPIALRAEWYVARDVANTLLAATRVSKRWQDVAGRVLERNCCIKFPFRPSRLESYLSRERQPATSMVLRLAPLDRSQVFRGILGMHEVLPHFKGIKSLHLHIDRTNLLPALGSPALKDLSELTLSGSDVIARNISDVTHLPNLSGLRSFSLASKTVGWLNPIIIETAKDTLVDLEIDTDMVRIPQDFYSSNSDLISVRHVSLRTIWQSGQHRVKPEGSLSRFPGVKSLQFLSALNAHEFHWALTPEVFDDTLATLPSSAKLRQLSLPIGKLSNLDLLLPFLPHESLASLRELLLPFISRKVLDAKGAARAFLVACEERGIRVVFKEELALLRTLR